MSETTEENRRSPVEEFECRAYPILYVDDERIALDLFRDLFHDRFTVHTAASAAEAEPLLREHHIALVLCDQRMPGMSGTDFLARIRQTHPEVLRILVTAYADMKSMVAAINAGQVYHYVEKPWDHQELAITLNRALEHVHLLRERDRLQKERVETLEKMARTNRLAAVGTLAAGIAHEIRNPLSSVLTFHQLLDEKLKELVQDTAQIERDEFWTRFAKIPLREVERIRGLIQELLDFSRESEGRYDFQSVSAAAVLEDVLHMLAGDRRLQTVTVNQQVDAALLVRAVPDKLKQVFLNLLLNSLYALPEEGGVLTLSVQADGDRVRIGIRDNGCGISPENLEKVFDPFFTTRDPGVGTGLGLTMCHHIIANHGGEMQIESQEGQGTLVSCLIPRADSA